MIPSATKGTQSGIRPIAAWDPSSTMKKATAIQPAPKKKRGKLAARLLIRALDDGPFVTRIRVDESGRTDGTGRPDREVEPTRACGKLRCRGGAPVPSELSASIDGRGYLDEVGMSPP